MNQSKQCVSCGAMKPLTHYSNTRKDFWQPKCIICRRISASGFDANDLARVERYREWCRDHWQAESWDLISSLNRHWNPDGFMKKFEDIIASHGKNRTPHDFLE